MRKKELEKIQNDLVERKRKLLAGSLEPRTNDLQSEREDLLDSGDVATVEVNQSLKIRIREREEKLLKKIDEALQRIKGGSFGTCEDCGQSIEVKRLKARPVTTFCIECKNRQEQEEEQE